VVMRCGSGVLCRVSWVVVGSGLMGDRMIGVSAFGEGEVGVYVR